MQASKCQKCLCEGKQNRMNPQSFPMLLGEATCGHLLIPQHQKSRPPDRGCRVLSPSGLWPLGISPKAIEPSQETAWKSGRHFKNHKVRGQFFMVSSHLSVGSRLSGLQDSKHFYSWNHLAGPFGITSNLLATYEELRFLWAFCHKVFLPKQSQRPNSKLGPVLNSRGIRSCLSLGKEQPPDTSWMSAETRGKGLLPRLPVGPR